MYPGMSYKGGGDSHRGARGRRGGGGGRCCFKCGQPDHLARDCPIGSGREEKRGPPQGSSGKEVRDKSGRGRGNKSLNSVVPVTRGTGLYRVSDEIAPSLPESTFADPSSMPVKMDISTWRQKDFHALVRAFVKNQASQELSFPPTLDAAQRNAVHKIAAVFGLDHKSYGTEPTRYLKLTKRTLVSAQQSAETAAEQGRRVKCIEGYQGAQMLPDDFIDREKLSFMKQTLLKYHAAMIRGIQQEARRQPGTKRQFHGTQPGLPSPPSCEFDKKKFEALQKFRCSLPASKHRTAIVDAVRHNEVVVISGDTGCGKTTQIPQMLYDAGIFPAGTDIICTQPRRISALSVAQRVAEERGEACGNSCGYIIRFENKTSHQSRIVYQTTGILLRRLHSEPELRGVACVIVDEVHERDLDTDFSLLLLRDRLAAQRAEPHRFPLKLKLVVMSATVQIDSLVAYFSKSNGGKAVPLITIPGTLFPVEEFFLEDAIAWVGGSASGQRALSFLSRSDGAPKEVSEVSEVSEAGDAGEAGEAGPNLYEKLCSSVFDDQGRDAEAMVPYELMTDLILYIHRANRDLSGSILVFLPGWAAIMRVADALRRSPAARELSVLLLHSSLTSAEQQRVFLPAPRRYRKVVLATSIAETSITIDDVAYVIDSGLIKGTSYDASGNTLALQATLIAKANGIQRRGRAGRCRQGVCVHLLPKSVYEKLPDFQPPEILRSPLEEICLQLKAIHPFERCASVLSRAMDLPSADSVEHAVRLLVDMGAFTEEEEVLTNLGRALAQLPLHPLLGKMLFTAAIFGVLESVATIAAGLSVKSPFVKPMAHQRAACSEALQRLDGGDLSDHMCVLKLHREWVRRGRSAQYAQDSFADQTTLRSLDRTKVQLVRLVQTSPFLRRWKDPLAQASRNNTNKGLIRFTMLYSLYPRLATLEYRANRATNKVNLLCWDNKPANLSMGSVLAHCTRRDYGSNSFVVYYERMQLESALNLFDSSVVSAVDVALCLRQLVVRPLLSIPDFLLRDEESTLAPPKRLNLDLLENKENYMGMFFDGDKKLFIAEKEVALVLEMCQECVDYYFACCIKELRADTFPRDLVTTLATLIGCPLTAAQADGNLDGLAPELEEEETGDEKELRAYGNAPGFVRGGYSGGDSSDAEEEAEDGPIVVDEAEEVDFCLELQLTDEQRRRVTVALGDLSIFRQAQVVGLDSHHNTLGDAKKEVEDMAGGNGEEAPTEGAAEAPLTGAAGTTRGHMDNDDNDDEDEDDDDTIVAQVGELKL